MIDSTVSNLDTIERIEEFLEVTAEVAISNPMEAAAQVALSHRCQAISVLLVDRWVTRHVVWVGLHYNFRLRPKDI
jgi:hypothetical protein